jgi:hypothetical protein
MLFPLALLWPSSVELSPSPAGAFPAPLKLPLSIRPGKKMEDMGIPCVTSSTLVDAGMLSMGMAPSYCMLVVVNKR